MAYINRNTRKALETLTLRLKVASKAHGESRPDSGSAHWHSTWDVAEYAHMGILALLGSSTARDNLHSHAEHNLEAAAIIHSIRCAGASI